MSCFAFFGIQIDGNVVLVAAVTAAAVTLVTTLIKERARLWVEVRLHRIKADADYEYEQRKKLRDTIGAYHGQLVEATTDFNYRLANLEVNISEGWLDQDGAFDKPVGSAYYFRSTVYRLLVLASVSNRFEREALVIDSRIAQERDLTFLLFVKAFRWALTDAALLKGATGYSQTPPYKHFLTDRLRQMCAAICVDGREHMFGDFEDGLAIGPADSAFVPALEFIDGMQRGDERWDRMMVLRLLLLSFIGAFGYPMQQPDQKHFNDVTALIDRDPVVKNLAKWLEKLGLAETDATQKLRNSLTHRLSPQADRSPRPPAV